MKITLIGIDLAKTIFQVCGVNQAGKAAFNRQVRRNGLMTLLRQYPDATIAMEACSGSNYWGRTLKAAGFQIRLIPPQHVKPFVKGNKNDRNDAFAITEAARRPDQRYVIPRSVAQTDLIQIHRLLSRKVGERTALMNQLRGFLNEYGIVVAKGKAALLDALPDLEWQQLNQTITTLNHTIRQQAKANEATQRLMAVKGVGEKTATAIVAYGGNGQAFKNGRHFAASIGVVPREHSSGGKQRLGGITKRGNPYLRWLLVQGAWSVISHLEGSDDRLSRWAKTIVERRGKHKAVLAVANKLARILWSMLYHQTTYKAI